MQEQDDLKYLWMWIRPCWSRSICGHEYVYSTAGTPLKRLWPLDKAVLEKVHLTVTVAVRKARPHQLYPGETVTRECVHWSRARGRSPKGPEMEIVMDTPLNCCKL